MILIGSVAVLTLVIMLGALGWMHRGFRAPRVKELQTPIHWAPNFQAVWIPTVDDKHIYAWFLPHPQANQTIVVVHGWGANMEMMLPFAQVFHQAGLNVLLFDARNHGQSELDGHSSMPKFAQDTQSALDWLYQHHPHSAERVGLLGHSVGASAAILTASRRHDMDALISISAFAHPEWLMTRFLQSKYISLPLVRLINRYIEWVIAHRFSDIASIYALSKVRCPTLLIHGGQDEVVPISDARVMYQRNAASHIQLWEIEQVGHADAHYIEQHAGGLLDFLRKAGFEVQTPVK